MQRRIVLLILASISVAGGGGAASADVLRLKDGTSIEGDVKKGEAGWVVTLPGGQTTTVSADQVKSIEAAAKGGDDMAGLASLRRSTENATDAQPVIDKYNRFIGQSAGTPAADEAKKDLAVWQSRLDRGLVRVGTRWVTREERSQLQLNAVQIADRARQQMKDGRWTDAEASLADALAADPNSPTALYLRALLAYQSGQFVAARKDLEAVKASTPNHGPTLNNLGVIAVRQNRMGEAVNYFDQAMRVTPLDRTVMDNVAEMLHALSEEAPRPNVQRALLQRATALFQEQETKLIAKMKEQGLNRWGATWVNDADYARLKEAQKKIQEKMTAMQNEFDTTQRLIAGIDDRIAADESTLRQLESQSFRQDLNGFLVQFPLPPVYYDIQRDIQTQMAARQQAAAKLDSLRQQAKTIQRELPVPMYTGTLQMAGPDGAPIVIAPAK